MNTRQVNGPAIAELLRDAQGLLAESTPHQVASQVGTLTSGTLYGSQVYLEQGMVITNANTQAVATIVTGLTHAWVGLYDSVGNLLATTADLTTQWSTGGFYTNAFTVPFTVVTAGIYYTAVLAVFSTTTPSLAMGVSPSAARAFFGTQVAGKPIYMWNQTGLSALPNPATQPYANPGNPGFAWVGLS